MRKQWTPSKDAKLMVNRCRPPINGEHTRWLEKSRRQSIPGPRSVIKVIRMVLLEDLSVTLDNRLTRAIVSLHRVSDRSALKCSTIERLATVTSRNGRITEAAGCGGSRRRTNLSSPFHFF